MTKGPCPSFSFQRGGNVRTVYPCTSLWSRAYSYDTVPSLSRHADINWLLRVRLYLAFRLCLSGRIRLFVIRLTFEIDFSVVSRVSRLSLLFRLSCY
eukprot:jgi/Botrbrau1/13743/Bobra.0356s0019.1